MNRSKWDQRIRRAQELADEHPFAAEVLRFYQHIARFQKALYSYVQDKRAEGPDVNVPLLLPRFPEFLSMIQAAAPEPLAACARDLAVPGGWPELLASCWRSAPDFEPVPGRAPELLAWMFLQPYAEWLADRVEPPSRDAARAVCPFCSAKPVAGILRQEGDGARRSLLCAWCATEWTFGRIVCPACGEQAVEKLAVYTASQFPHVRVEACDTCRHYIKSVDLTKNGRAVPVVDELATLPLNLWAREREYVKLRSNLLGI